jgi:hypothetical protein
LWSRLDPADPGPITAARLRVAKPNSALTQAAPHDTNRLLSVGALADPQPGGFAEVVVSNEDDALQDHTGYWDNPHEVTPVLVRELWGPGASESTGNFEQEEGLRALRRKLQILALSGPRLIAWYILPVVFLALMGQMDQGGPLTFVPRDSSSILQVVDAWGLSRLAGWPVFNTFLARPDGVIDCLLIALTGGIIATVLAQLLYGFTRSVLWNGFLKELEMFSATVPSGDRESRVARMEDGRSAQIVGIGVGRGIRR